MIGFLIYLPTLAFAPHSLFLLAAIWAYIRFWRNRSSLYNEFEARKIDFSIIILIVILSLFNYIFGFGVEHVISNQMPSFLLIPITFFIAIGLKMGDIKVLIALILIEVVAVYIEYMLGISTFFSSLSRYSELGSSDLLYYNKPLGFSYNSSIVAAKLFLAFILLGLIKMKTFWKIIAQVMLLIAIVLTFNRTVFVSIFIYITLTLVQKLMQRNFTFIKWNLSLLGMLILTILSIVLLVEYWEVLVYQLTRNTGVIEVSGRGKIWSYYMEFISENWLFGNNGDKFYFGKLHAHNSFLQLISTNGIIISMLYFYLILRNINWKNAILILSVISYSIFQFGIFWGISTMDIIFLYFVFIVKRQNQVKKLSLSTSN